MTPQRRDQNIYFTDKAAADLAEAIKITGLTKGQVVAKALEVYLQQLRKS